MKCNYKAEINFQDKIHFGLRTGSQGKNSMENVHVKI